MLLRHMQVAAASGRSLSIFQHTNLINHSPQPQLNDIGELNQAGHRGTGSRALLHAQSAHWDHLE